MWARSDAVSVDTINRFVIFTWIAALVNHVVGARIAAFNLRYQLQRFVETAVARNRLESFPWFVEDGERHTITIAARIARKNVDKYVKRKKKRIDMRGMLRIGSMFV
jgi:hypothetical protein